MNYKIIGAMISGGGGECDSYNYYSIYGSPVW